MSKTRNFRLFDDIPQDSKFRFQNSYLVRLDNYYLERMSWLSYPDWLRPVKWELRDLDGFDKDMISDKPSYTAFKFAREDITILTTIMNLGITGWALKDIPTEGVVLFYLNEKDMALVKVMMPAHQKKEPK